MKRLAAALGCASLLLVGCASEGYRDAQPVQTPAPHAPATKPRPAPPRAPAAAPQPVPLADPNETDYAPSADEVPPDITKVPDAVPQFEERSRYGNPDSYKVLGKRYEVLDDARGFRERGYASWYGKKFHGKRTSSGEPYDMYAMTAAHKTLPIPTYARVTNLTNGKSVVVKITDRGPFHPGRIVDLSYAAAARLEMLDHGSTLVQLEVVMPDETPGNTIVAAAPSAPPQPAALPPAPPPGPAVAIAAAPAGTTPPAQAPAAAAPPATSATSAPTVALANAAPAPVVRPAPPVTVAAAAPLHVGTPRYLQAGIFSDPDNAWTFHDRLKASGVKPLLMKSETRNNLWVYRVLIGPFADLGALNASRAQLNASATPTVPVAD